MFSTKPTYTAAVVSVYPDGCQDGEDNMAAELWLEMSVGERVGASVVFTNGDSELYALASVGPSVGKSDGVAEEANVGKVAAPPGMDSRLGASVVGDTVVLNAVGGTLSLTSVAGLDVGACERAAEGISLGKVVGESEGAGVGGPELGVPVDGTPVGGIDGSGLGGSDVTKDGEFDGTDVVLVVRSPVHGFCPPNPHVVRAVEGSKDGFDVGTGVGRGVG